jgi:hypothetical protein
MKTLTLVKAIFAVVCWSSCSGTPAASIDGTSDNNGGTTTKELSEGVDIRTGEIVLDNGTICLKQDLGRGGAITHLSQSGTNRNVVNVYDHGRLIQQSYYAGHAIDRQSEGQSPDWSPWTWNPIQGGNYAGKGSRIIEGRYTATESYVKCIPMLWDMNNHEAEAIMEQWTTIEGTTVHVRNRISCHRTDDLYGENVSCDQEIPAVYPISALSRLYAYVGNYPFTKADISALDVQRLEDGFWGRYSNVGEQWMAFVDDSKWGLGVYTPTAQRFLAGRSGSVGGDDKSASTSYIAPVCSAVLNKTSVMDYDYYLILDSLDNIRDAIYTIHEQQINNL